MATTIKTQWGEVTPEELSNIAAYTSKLQGNFTPAEITKMTKNPYFKEMATVRLDTENVFNLPSGKSICC